ncbi:CBS domain-containing protein [Nocardioides sp.]|uniref:CBS domain-containing protein n=1 Tax=Nocardioides sp. TaxID=35761 RepID=UPI002F424C6B
MTAPAVTVAPDTSLEQTIRLLDEHQITAMPVVDAAGHLLGVVSEADVLRDSVLADRRVHERLVEITGRTVHLVVTDVMTHLPIHVSQDDDVAQAVELLVSSQVKSLPVVSDSGVVGVVSRRDVIAVLARQDVLIEAEIDDQLRRAGVECTVDVDEGVVELRDAESPDSLRIARVIASRIPGVIGLSTGAAARA